MLELINQFPPGSQSKYVDSNQVGSYPVSQVNSPQHPYKNNMIIVMGLNNKNNTVIIAQYANLFFTRIGNGHLISLRHLMVSFLALT
jgi:hypothetical protein